MCDRYGDYLVAVGSATARLPVGSLKLRKPRGRARRLVARRALALRRLTLATARGTLGRALRRQVFRRHGRRGATPASAAAVGRDETL